MAQPIFFGDPLFVLAVLASTASDVEWPRSMISSVEVKEAASLHDDSITLLVQSDTAADFVDDTHVLQLGSARANF